MKKNKKNGFFLSETMIVITIVTIVMLGVFKIFSSTYTKFKENENYNTVNAITAISALRLYYDTIEFDMNNALGNNYYIDLTNNASVVGDHYTYLKNSLNIDKVYLFNMDTLFDGSNINIFDLSLRKYLKIARANNEDFLIVVALKNNEYASANINLNAAISLVGDKEDEYAVYLGINQEYIEPGYIGTNDIIPTITGTIDNKKEGKYYLEYDFNGYKLRRKVEVKDIKQVYLYTGNYQTFTVPYTGWYEIELLGAEGGNSNFNLNFEGGKGAYVHGRIYLTKNEKLYIYVGGQGVSTHGTTIANIDYNGNGYNGGAGATFMENNSSHGGGGGATDIRLVSGNWNSILSLKSRIMIAGGGGGGSSHSAGQSYSGIGGSGGGLIGGTAILGDDTCYSYGVGGTQVNGGASITCAVMGQVNNSRGSFGFGSGVLLPYENAYSPAGGGGGYYGGGEGTHAAGGGGSSYISGYAGVVSIDEGSTLESITHTDNTTLHYSGKYFIDGKMESGVNEGNGKAIITLINTVKPERVNAKLNNVRYIKDCINGSSENADNRWIEIQAIKDGTNIANKRTNENVLISTNGTVYPNWGTGTLNTIIDGDATASDELKTVQVNAGTNICVEIDLGLNNDLDEIAVWHYWDDGRTYNNNVTSVSNDGTTWTPVINMPIAETSDGKRVNAYSGVKMQINNLVQNSDFSDGITNWINYGCTSSINNNIATITPISQYGGLMQNVNYELLKGHVIYSQAKLKGDNVEIYWIAINDSVIQTVDAANGFNTWKTVSGRQNFSNSAIAGLMKTQDNRASGWSTHYLKEPLVVDLTATFGAGNEPSKEWCDENFKYFDGTITEYLNY